MKTYTIERKELAICRPSYYPDCLSKAIAFDMFFCWENSRQGHYYWRDKLPENWEEIVFEEDFSIEDTVTESDKFYLSLLALAKKHNLNTFVVSSGVRYRV